MSQELETRMFAMQTFKHSDVCAYLLNSMELLLFFC